MMCLLRRLPTGWTRNEDQHSRSDVPRRWQLPSHPVQAVVPQLAWPGNSGHKQHLLDGRSHAGKRAIDTERCILCLFVLGSVDVVAKFFFCRRVTVQKPFQGLANCAHIPVSECCSPCYLIWRKTLFVQFCSGVSVLANAANFARRLSYVAIGLILHTF